MWVIVWASRLTSPLLHQFRITGCQLCTGILIITLQNCTNNSNRQAHFLLIAFKIFQQFSSYINSWFPLCRKGTNQQHLWSQCSSTFVYFCFVFFVPLLLMPKHQTHASRHYLYQHKNAPIWLSLLFCFPQETLEGPIPFLFIYAHTDTHTESSIQSFLFSLHCLLSLPFLLLCLSRLCVSVTPFCGGPTSGTAVSHKIASSFNGHIDAASLCVSQSVPLTLSVFFLLSAHIPVWLSFFPLSAFISSVFWYLCGSVQAFLYIVYSLPCAIQQISPSCFKVTVFKWNMMVLTYFKVGFSPSFFFSFGSNSPVDF